MINIMFREGNKHVSPVLDLRRELLNKLSNVTESNVWKLSCPTHKSRSRATLLIDVAEGSSEWNIVDFCCEDFCHEISNGMPHPWNHRPGMRTLERAA